MEYFKTPAPGLSAPQPHPCCSLQEWFEEVSLLSLSLFSFQLLFSVEILLHFWYIPWASKDQGAPFSILGRTQAGVEQHYSMGQLQKGRLGKERKNTPSKQMQILNRREKVISMVKSADYVDALLPAQDLLLQSEDLLLCQCRNASSKLAPLICSEIASAKVPAFLYH